jgi:hypothetical protein
VWQKDGQISGFLPSGIVSIKTSSDITTITKDQTNYHYYKSLISSPTYINVLDYIMLTAENYDTIIKSGTPKISPDIFSIVPVTTIRVCPPSSVVVLTPDTDATNGPRTAFFAWWCVITATVNIIADSNAHSDAKNISSEFFRVGRTTVHV